MTTPNPKSSEVKAKFHECNCLEDIRGKLEAHHGEDSNVELELKAFISMSDESRVANMGADLPPLYYSYKQGKKRRKSYVKFLFCPFCGKAK